MISAGCKPQDRSPSGLLELWSLVAPFSAQVLSIQDWVSWLVLAFFAPCREETKHRGILELTDNHAITSKGGVGVPHGPVWACLQELVEGGATQPLDFFC